MRILGLDVGDKKIGVAISDPTGILASPLTIITYEEDRLALEAISEIARQQQVEQIVVGLPRSMDGSLGKQAQKVEAFVEKLHSCTTVPIIFRDERLTTVSAKRLMQAASGKKTRSKARDDAVAAAVLLQAYLDEKSDA